MRAPAENAAGRVRHTSRPPGLGWSTAYGLTGYRSAAAVARGSQRGRCRAPVQRPSASTHSVIRPMNAHNSERSSPLTRRWRGLDSRFQFRAEIRCGLRLFDGHRRRGDAGLPFGALSSPSPPVSSWTAPNHRQWRRHANHRDGTSSEGVGTASAAEEPKVCRLTAGEKWIRNSVPGFRSSIFYTAPEPGAARGPGATAGF